MRMSYLCVEVYCIEKDSIVNCDEIWCKVRKYDHYKSVISGCWSTSLRK